MNETTMYRPFNGEGPFDSEGPCDHCGACVPYKDPNGSGFSLLCDGCAAEMGGQPHPMPSRCRGCSEPAPTVTPTHT